MLSLKKFDELPQIYLKNSARDGIQTTAFKSKMKQNDNPAWRLHDILKAARSITHNHPIIKVWTDVLKLPENDLPAMYRALVALQELVIDT